MLTFDARRRIGRLRLDLDIAVVGTGITALFGRSGAGKSITLNMIAGLERPDDGRIAVAGRVLFDSASGIDLPPERRGFGYVFQDGRLFPHFDVRGNLRYGIRRRGERGLAADFDQIVELLDLGSLLRRFPRHLSGGERRRVAIGRALLAKPEFLLLDEPLTGIDAELRENVMAFIEKLRREVAIPMVYVSHWIDEVLRLADQMVMMDKGALVAAGSPEEVLNRPEVAGRLGAGDAGTVFAARILDHEEKFGLSRLAFAGGTLQVPRIELPPTTWVRLKVYATDVSLALTPPRQSSVLNVFRGTITALEGETDAAIDVVVDIGCPLRARITRKSAAELRLEVGVQVHALVKAVSFIK